MKKIKSLLLSVLALGCVTMAGCGLVPKGGDKYTVTLMYNGEVISTMEKDKATHLDAPPAPTKEGYTFKGWYVDEALTIPYTPDLLSANLTLYAKFEADTLYITLNLNGGSLDGEATVSVKHGETYTLPVPTKEGYTFLGWTLDGEDFPSTGTYSKTNSIRVSANWVLGDVAGAYLITLNYNGGAVNGETVQTVAIKEGETYSLPTPTRTGYKFEGYTITINGTTTPFAQTGTFDYEDNIMVTATWSAVEEDADEVPGALFLNKGNYFKEREDDDADTHFTYVFVTGGEYNFESLAGLEITDVDAGALTQTGKSFVANKAENSFKLHITKVVNGVTVSYTRDAKIVDQVSVFNGGADYVGSWGAGVANRNVNFLQTKEDATMAVGASNFKPDLAVGTLNSQALTFAKAYVEVTAKVGGDATTAFEYVNGVINFDASLIGQTVELTFAPKYSLTGAKHTIKVTVNNGVNVYTNDDLRLAYGDHSTNTINVLRNIKAVLGSGALNPDGTPINAYQYGVYVRNVANPNDQVVINGNFFGIDGSQLPILKGPYQNSDPTVALTDVQTGIFLYKNGNETSTANGYHSGQVTFNDLFVTGNYTMPSNTYEPMAGYDTGFLVGGGTYLGLVVEGGTFNVNNTTVNNTNIAVLMRGGVSAADATQPAAQLNLNYAKFEKSFNNSIYAWNINKVDIKNSVLTTAGGALIHFDDIARGENVVSSFSMDTASKFTNWIIGTEAYWTCRTGMSELALGMKTTIEQTIGAVSKYPGFPEGHPLYNKPLLTALDSTQTKFNLVLLVQSGGGNPEDWTKDPHKVPAVNVTANMMTPFTSFAEIPAILMNGTTFLQFDTRDAATGALPTGDSYRMGLLEVATTIPLDQLLQYLG